MPFPIPAIISGILSIGGTWLQGRQDTARRKDELKETVHKASIKRISDGDASAAELDRISMGQRGWKDDYLLLLTTLPLALLFIAPLLSISSVEEIHAAVESGFVALNKTPEYYWYALALIYIDTFGFRRMLRVGFERWISKKLGTTDA